MDGRIAESELKPPPVLAGGCTIRFELATAADEPSIRRLLRENPFAGEISISLQTEPDYFAAAELLGSNHYTIVASENDRLVCVGTVSQRQRFINGKPMLVGYLSGLRLDRSCRNKFSIIRRGYQFFHEVHQNGGAAIYMTSIISDNTAARRLLERNLPGMPTYDHLEDFVTCVIPVGSGAKPVSEVLRRAGFFRRTIRLFGLPQRPAWSFQTEPSVAEAGITFRAGTDRDVESIISLLNACNQQHQFAMVWRAEDFNPATGLPGLRPTDFQLALSGNELIACAAIWDQRAFKQTVIAGYSARLRWMRPLLNCVPRMPRLPAIGETLAQAFISPVAIKAGYQHLFPPIIRCLFTEARRRGLEYLVAGFAARDSRGIILRKCFGGRRYDSRLYTVHWPDADVDAMSLDARIASPEVALL